MKAQIRRHIRKAFSVMGDLVVLATIRHQTGSQFNDETGMKEETYTDHDVKVLITDYEKWEQNKFSSLIDSGDKKILLPTEQINFHPKAGIDQIEISDTWERIIECEKKHDALYVIKI